MKIAVIPARGGSKRIPRKNILPFAGLPIIGYSIRAALRCELFDKVIVSTDDAEIADVARGLGATTPFVRPAALADDYTGTNAVVRHALEWHVGHGEHFTHACCIYATAPFIQERYLRESLKCLIESGRDFAFSVTTFPFPVHRGLSIAADGTVEPIYPQFATTRSQDLPHVFHDAGQFYWGLAEAFMGEVPLYSAASVGVLLPRYLVQDIDTRDDWERAQHMYRALQLAGELAE